MTWCCIKRCSIVTSTVNQTSKGVLKFLYKNVYDVFLFFLTQIYCHTKKWTKFNSREQFQTILLSFLLCTGTRQYSKELANSWLRADILNVPEVCNINRGQTLETKVSLESSKILWREREPHSPVRHLRQKKEERIIRASVPSLTLL